MNFLKTKMSVSKVSLTFSNTLAMNMDTPGERLLLMLLMHLLLAMTMMTHMEKGMKMTTRWLIVNVLVFFTFHTH